MRAVVGVDVGTQGSKVGVYLEDGTLIAHAYAEHTFTYPGAGWVEMDPNQIEDAVVGALASAVQSAREQGIPPSAYAGIALSGILCGPVLVDEDWVPVRPIIPFLDMRARREVESIQRLEPTWIEESGTNSLDTYITPATLHWVRDHEPDAYAKTSKVLSLAPYIAGRLAGLRAPKAFIDPTHLSGWIIGWDARRLDFSPGQLETLGISADLLPRVVPSTDIVGGLTSEMSDRTGLPRGLPVAAGAGDVMQSNLAAGQRAVGQATDVAGTASLITITVASLDPEISRTPGLLYSPGTLPGTSFYWGYVKAGGLSLRWFRDQVLGRSGDDEVYRELDALAGAVAPGAHGILFMPYLSGGGPDFGNAQGTWLGLAAETGTALLWRSLLESIALEYATFLRTFRSRGVAVSEVLAVGGGSRSALWNQIKADVTGVPWRVPARQDGAVLANAALASAAVGLGSDVGSVIREWVSLGPAAVPQADAHRLYIELARRRDTLLAGPMREVFEELHKLRLLQGEPS
ncbi:MAG: FGGY-family carbohydrate kinase [Candidatus Nanopelagicales bacterium]